MTKSKLFYDNYPLMLFRVGRMSKIENICDTFFVKVYFGLAKSLSGPAKLVSERIQDWPCSLPRVVDPIEKWLRPFARAGCLRRRLRLPWDRKKEFHANLLFFQIFFKFIAGVVCLDIQGNMDGDPSTGIFFATTAGQTASLAAVQLNVHLSQGRQMPVSNRGICLVLCRFVVNWEATLVEPQFVIGIRWQAELCWYGAMEDPQDVGYWRIWEKITQLHGLIWMLDSPFNTTNT